MPIVIYPGSFDPIHNGHIDIVQRAASLFEQVVVAVYDTPSKRLLFDTGERLRLAAAALSHLANVQVIAYQGLTVDLARRLGATAMVRGLRAITDYEYESQLAQANRKLAPEIDTVCLITSLGYAYLSASILKEVAMLQGNIADWVPPLVAEALHARLAATGDSSG